MLQLVNKRYTTKERLKRIFLKNSVISIFRFFFFFFSFNQDLEVGKMEDFNRIGKNHVARLSEKTFL